MTRDRLLVTAALVVVVLGALVVARQVALPGLTDALNHPPPTSGTYAYSTFKPAAAGVSYVDPVFGATARRITGDAMDDDLYARNMWWNADATKYFHYGNIIDTTTGALTHTVPKGSYSYDAGFDPVDPNVFYYISGSTIHKVVLGAAGAKTDTVWFTAPATLKSLGGSENWLSADGRLLVVSYGADPSVHVLDTQNLAAGPFAGAIPQGSSTGYAAMLPSGRFIVTTSGAGYLGNAAVTTFRSYAINLAARTLSTTGNAFWNLCGDHGAFISPSDGHDYLITTSCYDVNNVMRVDVTGTVGTESAQISANKILLPNLSWSYSVHLTAVAKGAMRDWAFMDTEGGGDDPSSWAPYQNEIVGFNVVTGETRRLAHHRSNIGDYFTQPRISASWDGQLVGWASNFQQTGVDVYALVLGAAAVSLGGTGDTTPPTVSVTSPTAGATLAGSVTVAATAADNVGVAGVQILLDGAALGAEDTAAPYQAAWATTGVADGTHTLTARARDAAGNASLSSPVSVTVSNLPPPTLDTTWPTVSVTAPVAGATVAGTIAVAAAASDDVAVVGVQFQVDGIALGTEDLVAPYSVAWNTTLSSPGAHNVTATARDAAGHVTRSAMTSVTVNNGASTVLPGGALFGSVTTFSDARTLAPGAGLEMPAGSAALVREFGASDGVSTLSWRVNGTAVSVVLNGAVVWTGTAYSTTLLRVQWTGTQLRAIRGTTVRGSAASLGPVHVFASGTLFPALTVK